MIDECKFNYLAMNKFTIYTIFFQVFKQKMRQLKLK